MRAKRHNLLPYATEVLYIITWTEFMQETEMNHGESSREALQAIAYERLSSYLREHEDHVCEIEVLPPAVQPPDGILMHDGLNIGVPKKILVLAYIEARRQFFCHTDHSNPSLEALQATKVMLLFDPEHLTATNYRKRWLIGIGTGGYPDHELMYRRVLYRELNFLDSILTSPLHRQTKSPTLWHHRLWTVNSLWKLEIQTSDKDQRAAFWRAELAAVCKSGERHPKNYYAWQYARRIAPRLTDDDKEGFVNILKDWCCKHPSDISGWTFLLVLLTEMRNETKALNVSMDVIKYTVRLQAEQESLWVFIKTTALRVLTQEGYLEVCALLRDQHEDQTHVDRGTATPERGNSTQRWSKLRDQFLHLRDHPVNSVWTHPPP